MRTSNKVNAYTVDNGGFHTTRKPKITPVSTVDGAFGYKTFPKQAPVGTESFSPRMCSDNTSSLLLELDLGIDLDVGIDKSCFLEFAIETLQSEDEEIELSPALLRIVPDAKSIF